MSEKATRAELDELKVVVGYLLDVAKYMVNGDNYTAARSYQHALANFERAFLTDRQTYEAEIGAATIVRTSFKPTEI